MLLKRLCISDILAGKKPLPLAALPTPELIQMAPPPAKQETPPTPRNGVVWSSGYWKFSNNWFVWCAGHWELSRPGQRYVAPHWECVAGGWRFAAASWQAEDGSELAPERNKPAAAYDALGAFR